MKEYTVEVDKYNTKRYFLNGQRHREDGPAVEHANGDEWWFLNGQLHREDGPAIECVDGSRYWYLNGKKLTEAEVGARIKTTPRELTVAYIEKLLGYKVKIVKE